MPLLRLQRLPRADLYVRWFALVVVAWMLIRIWTSWSGDQFSDDVRSTYAVLNGGGAAYFFDGYNGHFGPVSRLASWLLVESSPFNYRLEIVVVAIVAALSQCAAFALFRRLFGPGLISFGLGCLIACSTLYAATLSQWSLGLPTALMLAFGSLMISGYLAWRSTGSRRSLALAVVFGASGLLCDPLFLFYLLLLFAIAIAGVRTGPQSRASVRMRPDFRPAAAVAIVAIAYVVAVGIFGGDRGDIAVAQPSSAWDVAYRLYAETLLPSLLGGPWTVDSFNQFPAFGSLPGVVVSLVIELFLAAVIAVLALNRGTWRYLAAGIVFAAVLTAACFITVRFGPFGVELFRQGRFAASILLPTLVLIGLGASSTAERARFTGTRRKVSARPLGAVVGIVIVAVLVQSSWVTTFAVRDAIEATSTRPYWDNVRAGLAAHPDVAIVDRPMPASILDAGFLPEVGHVSSGLRYFVDGQTFPASAVQFHVVNADGTVSEAAFEVNRSSPPGPNPGCGYPVAPGVPIVVPVPDGLFKWEWVIKINYLAAGDATMRVKVSDAPDGTFDVQAIAGAHSVYLVAPGQMGPIRIDTDSTAPGVCVGSINVGTFS